MEPRTSETYEELYRKTIELYQEQQYAQAYDVLTEEGARFHDHTQDVLYLRSCMAARTGRPDLAISLIEESLDRGNWYSERIMRQSPSWQELQGRPEFERLVELNKAKEDELAGRPQTLILAPSECSEEQPCPLFLALHGNTQSGKSALDGWRDVVDEGWALAAVQSGQMGGKGWHIWDDQDVAMREVASEYEKLRQRADLDHKRVIVAGFSLGGETALRIALSGVVPVKGFVLLGPGGPTMDEAQGWQPLIEQAQGRNLRGYIFMGENEDPQAHEGARATVKMLNEGGIPCELATVPGIGHVYPDDFGPSLRGALSFVERQG
jgi:predicted esterase